MGKRDHDYVRQVLQQAGLEFTLTILRDAHKPPPQPEVVPPAVPADGGADASAGAGAGAGAGVGTTF